MSCFHQVLRAGVHPRRAGLYYSAFPAPQPGAELSTQDLGNALYYHALGTAAAADRRVLEDSAPMSSGHR